MVLHPYQKMKHERGNQLVTSFELRAAFDQLFREYFIPLCTYCQYRFDLDSEAAKDVVHNAFLRLVESGGDFSSESSLKAYLYKTTTNLCLDRARHETVRQQHVQFIQRHLSKEEREENIAEFKELQKDVHNAIAELPSQMREVFELSRYEGLKYAAIAERLGLSVKTVETQMSRALAKLRKKLGPYLR